MRRAAGARSHRGSDAANGQHVIARNVRRGMGGGKGTGRAALTKISSVKPTVLLPPFTSLGARKGLVDILLSMGGEGKLFPDGDAPRLRNGLREPRVMLLGEGWRSAKWWKWMC